MAGTCNARRACGGPRMTPALDQRSGRAVAKWRGASSTPQRALAGRIEFMASPHTVLSLSLLLLYFCRLNNTTVALMIQNDI